MNKPSTTTSATSLQTLSLQFIEHLERRLFSRCTIYARSRQLHRLVKFCDRIPIESASQLTRESLQAYHQSLCDHRTAAGFPLKSGTIQHFLVGVNTFLGWLVREQILSVNPLSSFEMPRKGHRLPRAVLTPDEVKTIFALPDVRTVRGLRDRAILEVLYSTGLRRMELCRLNLVHMDFANGLVRVEQGKGRKDRLVPIGCEALRRVERYLVESRDSLKPALEEPAVFLNLFGGRLSEQLLGGIVRRLVRQANLGKTGSCHLFRHAFATGLLRNGCDLRHIQTMLGHASLETTQLYTHLDTGQIQAAHRQYHPAGRSRVTGVCPEAMAQLVSDAKELDARDLGKVVEYVGLLKLARLHRRNGSEFASKSSPCA